MKQSQVCPKCVSYMEFVKRATWLKCSTCGYMVKVIKRIVTPKEK